MRKFLFYVPVFICLYLQFGPTTYAGTDIVWNSNSTPAIATECPAASDGAGRTFYGTPVTNSSVATLTGNRDCIMHYYYSSADHTVAVSYNGAGKITACPAGERAVGYNGSNQMTCRKYDDIDPLVTDIGTPSPASNSNLLASNSYNFSVPVTGGGESPITVKKVFFENWNTTDSLLGTSHEYAPSGYNENIRNVDNNRDADGSRTYRLQVARICDEAGNCLGTDDSSSNLASFYYKVYANSLAITTKQVGAHALNSGLVADGQSRSMPITLGDTYGNVLVPASGISRTIDLNFNITNALYLDQYNQSGPKAVFIQPPSGTFTNTLTSFNNEPSTDGQYMFNFKIYTPTYQNYKADPSGQFRINDIQFDVNGSLGSISNQAIASSNIDFDFKPLYQTAISGDLRDGGFIEGARQDSILTLTRNGTVDGASPSVQLEFGGTNSNKFKLYGDITEGGFNTHRIASHSGIYTPVIFPASSPTLYTKLIQNTGAVARTLSGVYLSTHITYTLDGNSILYNSDIVGKPNYFGTNTDLTQQSGVKIVGLTSAKKGQELIMDQFTKDVNTLGKSNKFSNKAGVIKNATAFARSTTASNGALYISKLDGTANPGGGIASSNVLYFGGLNGSNVSLGNGSNVSVTGRRTVLIVGGNLYIKNNMYYNSKSKDMLGIIVLKDRAGKGGNIYIDPSVTNIAGTLFAEKSILNYDGTKELDGNTPISTIKNQLHIYGNVFSENTIGGSRKTIPQCPFYVKGTCDVTIAQKYDLNYLRRYYLVNNTYPYGNGKVIGGGTCNSTSTCGTHDLNLKQTRFFTSTSDAFASYPVVIEYNTSVQKTPPPLFTVK